MSGGMGGLTNAGPAGFKGPEGQIPAWGGAPGKQPKWWGTQTAAQAGWPTGPDGFALGGGAAPWGWAPGTGGGATSATSSHSAPGAPGGGATSLPPIDGLPWAGRGGQGAPQPKPAQLGGSGADPSQWTPPGLAQSPGSMTQSPTGPDMGASTGKGGGGFQGSGFPWGNF